MRVLGFRHFSMNIGHRRPHFAVESSILGVVEIELFVAIRDSHWGPHNLHSHFSGPWQSRLC